MMLMGKKAVVSCFASKRSSSTRVAASPNLPTARKPVAERMKYTPTIPSSSVSMDTVPWSSSLNCGPNVAIVPDDPPFPVQRK